MQVIILEQLDFTWDTNVVDNVILMWNNGTSLQEIVSKIKRREEEVFLLLLHLSMKNRINKRENGIWGG